MRVTLRSKQSTQQGKHNQRDKDLSWMHELFLKLKEEPCRRHNLVQVKNITYSHNQCNETPHSRKKKKILGIRKFEEDGVNTVNPLTFVSTHFDLMDRGCLDLKQDNMDNLFETTVLDIIDEVLAI